MASVLERTHFATKKLRNKSKILHSIVTSKKDYDYTYLLREWVDILNPDYHTYICDMFLITPFVDTVRNFAHCYLQQITSPCYNEDQFINITRQLKKIYLYKEIIDQKIQDNIMEECVFEEMEFEDLDYVTFEPDLSVDKEITHVKPQRSLGSWRYGIPKPYLILPYTLGARDYKIQDDLFVVRNVSFDSNSSVLYCTNNLLVEKVRECATFKRFDKIAENQYSFPKKRFDEVVVYLRRWIPYVGHG